MPCTGLFHSKVLYLFVLKSKVALPHPDNSILMILMKLGSMFGIPLVMFNQGFHRVIYPPHDVPRGGGFESISIEEAREQRDMTENRN